ncbi:reverse transcriptase domain-containing protein [Tanacetum coccineum]|uniref:Reverse transcriptase domain-containing protein n=1 Tax=Tanacetum coccineum TaxID=301880 RepID=A0ABQ5D0M0_9ASTR
MRTRSQTRNRNRQQQSQPAVVQPFHLEEPFVNPPLVPMADNRTMAQLLQAPTEGYEDAIVIPEINANFELKHGLINLVQNKQFFGHDKEDPHAHIRYFNKITSTMRFPDVPSTSIKLMLFPFSLEGSARIWLEKEPPRSILTWDDLVSKFINQFFPPSKTTNLQLRQLDTFYNALNANDQDSLNSAAGKNFLDKMPRECLRIIESKSKVRNSRNKAVVAKFSQAHTQPNEGDVSKTIFENYVKADDAVLRNMQNQGQGLQNQMTNLTEMLSKFITSNTASSSNPGTLPIQTEPEQNPETSMDKVQKSSSEKTAQVLPPEDHDSIFIEIPKPKAKKTISEPNSSEPNSYQPKLPYPERMKVREKDKPSAQQSRFMKLFKQLRLEIGLKDALIEMPKFNKWLSTLLRNKEKLEEIAITTVNAECSAIILNKVPEKLKDPGKFLIPCALQELDRTNALADSGASINLLPHYIYKQLGLGALKPTRMTLELANHSVTHPMGIAEDVVNKQFAHAISVIDFSKDEPFSGSTTNHSDALPPSSSPMKTSDNLEEFADELTLLKKVVHEENFQVYSSPLFEFEDNFTSSNVNPLFNEIDEDVENKNSYVSNSDESVLLNTPLSDKVESSHPEDDIDEIDAFLTMEVSSNFEEGYFDSEGDLIFLENLLSDDTTHNLAPEVISDHEPKQDESIHNTSITFSPRSDPLHHEFAGELITLPSRTENVHANPSSIIESLPTSLIPVEDNDLVQEEIDIFLVPDDLIPPGVENDDYEDVDNEL